MDRTITLSNIAITAVVFLFAATPLLSEMMQAQAQRGFGCFRVGPGGCNSNNYHTKWTHK